MCAAFAERATVEEHDDTAGGRHAFSRAGEISLALTIPSAVALMVIPLPLVSVLFQRGATGASDASAIALARDNSLPLIVFSLDEPGGFRGILAGEGTYTRVQG